MRLSKIHQAKNFSYIDGLEPLWFTWKAHTPSNNTQSLD